LRDSRSRESHTCSCRSHAAPEEFRWCCWFAQQLIGDSAATVYFINAVSLVQTITPKPMLGRVNASLRFVRLASVLAGQLVAGLAGGIVGLRPTIAIGAAGLWVAAALLGFSEVGALTGMEEHAAPVVVE
jgi:hypothetical protein